MTLIKILPENLINQIAAGEVVERPASVVKELVENSLDAGAENIIVEIREGGIDLIKISDDGKGMSEDDLKLSLTRHATSKINDEKDLWKIRTMGFRGEALASISSVAKVNIRSKIEGEISGKEISCEGGKTQEVTDFAMNTGTEVEVKELFFNTPARQKYLKKVSTELSHITSLLNSIALANYEISFKLIHNDKVVFDLPKVTDFISRISDVFGKATSEAMLPVFYGASTLKIEGFIGKPSISRSSGKHQYFFVNKRPIQHGLFANTIKRAYHSMLMEHKKPVFLLNIDIPTELIDVNVHPRKLEIRFENQQEILKIIYGMVKTALDKASLIPKGYSESRRYMSDNFPTDEKKSQETVSQIQQVANVQNPGFQMPKSNGFANSNFNSTPSGFSFPKKKVGNFEMNFNPSATEKVDFSSEFQGRSQQDFNKLETEGSPFEGMEAIAQLSTCYIIAKRGEELILIDQHAGHERVRFEELMNQYESQKKSIQPLLVPVSVELTHDESQIIEENNEFFQELGFGIEHFGGKTFVVNEVPTCLAKEDLDEVLRGVLDDILAHKGPSKFQGKKEEMITYLSCRSAIKFGQKLEIVEMQSLIDQMKKLVRPYTCPHGRPTMISLTLDELGKMFGRK